MTAAPKIKVSLTLSSDLVEKVDRMVTSGRGPSRSEVIDEWLRAAALREAESTLASEMIAYYETRSAAERREDERMARAMSRASRRLDVDSASPRPKKRRRR